MPELERWVLHRLAELDGVVRKAIDDYDFHTMFTALHNFCAVDLSAFYFDIRKDRLYCDGIDDPGRRATRTVMDRTFDCLARWLAPILCFTAEEAWLARHGDTADRTIHTRIVRRCARIVAQPGAGGAVGRVARPAPRRDRRAGDGARRQAHRLEPPGRGRGVRAGTAVAGAARCRSRRVVHHLGGNDSRYGIARGCLHACPMSPKSALSCRRRTARNASAAGGCCPKSGRSPRIRDLCRRCSDVLDRGALPVVAAVG